MKILLFLISISVFFLSCDNGSENKKKSKVIGDSSQTLNILDTNNKRDYKDSGLQNHILSNDILGTWSYVGNQDTAIIITKTRVYDETGMVSYKYVLMNDTMVVHHSDYGVLYLVMMKRMDTLILDDLYKKDTFYRLKNSPQFF